MKTREELAKEYAYRISKCNIYESNQMGWPSSGQLYEDGHARPLYASFISGFDVGYARAIEMLRSDEARTLAFNDRKVYFYQNETLADWLEKQK